MLVEMERPRLRELTQNIYYNLITIQASRNGAYPIKGIDTNSYNIIIYGHSIVEMERTRLRELTQGGSMPTPARTGR